MSAQHAQKKPVSGKQYTALLNNTLPPYDLEAEQSVLGAIFIENEAIYAALEIMAADDFYRPTHTTIFKAMLTLIERKDTADLITVKSLLETQKDLDQIGGPAYLATLIDLTPTAANVTYHAGIVHDKAVKRQLLTHGIETVSRCYGDAEPAEDILHAAEQGIFAISTGTFKRGFVSVSDVLGQEYPKIVDRIDAPVQITGLPTGFVDLDAMLCGLQPSDLIIIAARPAMGKTAFAMNIAAHLGIHKKIPVAVFNLEMSKEQLFLRMLASESQVNSKKIRTGHLDEAEQARMAYAAEFLHTSKIFIDDTPAISVLEIKSKVKQAILRYGVQLVIIDYLQLMNCDGKHENRVQEISEITRGLKMLAKDVNLPVICLSQLSRACEQRSNKEPILSDLRDSGTIEQDSDIVIFPFRPAVYIPDAPDGVAEIIIGKHRSGETGSCQVGWQKDITKFVNLDHYHGAVSVPAYAHHDNEEVF